MTVNKHSPQVSLQFMKAAVQIGRVHKAINCVGLTRSDVSSTGSVLCVIFFAVQQCVQLFDGRQPVGFSFECHGAGLL